METIFEAPKGLHASEALRSDFLDRSSGGSLEGFTDLGGVWIGHAQNVVYGGMNAVTLYTEFSGGVLGFKDKIYGLHNHFDAFSGSLHTADASVLEVHSALSTAVPDTLWASHLVVQERLSAGAAGSPSPRAWESHVTERPKDTQRLVDRITAYRDLEADGDEDEVTPVSKETVAAAVAIVDAISAGGLRLPQPTLSTDGEIGLSWFCGRDLFELTIDADLHIVWVLQVGKKVVPGEVHPVGSETFPGMVVEAVREFYAGVTKSAMLPR